MHLAAAAHHPETKVIKWMLSKTSLLTTEGRLSGAGMLTICLQSSAINMARQCFDDETSQTFHSAGRFRLISMSFILNL